MKWTRPTDGKLAEKMYIIIKYLCPVSAIVSFGHNRTSDWWPKNKEENPISCEKVSVNNNNNKYVNDECHVPEPFHMNLIKFNIQRYGCRPTVSHQSLHRQCWSCVATTDGKLCRFTHWKQNDHLELKLEKFIAKKMVNGMEHRRRRRWNKRMRNFSNDCRIIISAYILCRSCSSLFLFFHPEFSFYFFFPEYCFCLIMIHLGVEMIPDTEFSVRRPHRSQSLTMEIIHFHRVNCDSDRRSTPRQERLNLHT